VSFDFVQIPGRAQREHAKLIADFLKHAAVVSEIKLHKHLFTRIYLEGVSAVMKDENSSRVTTANPTSMAKYMKRIHDRDGDCERHVLRKNLYFLAKKTKHLGLVMTQLTWTGLLNSEDKRNIVSLIIVTIYVL